MMTNAQRRKIEALADRGLRAVAIGRAIHCKTERVRWYLYTIGQVARSCALYPPMCLRAGRIVRRFSAAEDALLVAMRRRGYTCEAIAAECGRRFETQRTASGIYARLVIIARDEP